jgi:hypothetical protein
MIGVFRLRSGPAPWLTDPDSPRFVGMSVHEKRPISERKRSHGDGWITIGDRKRPVGNNYSRFIFLSFGCITIMQYPANLFLSK